VALSERMSKLKALLKRKDTIVAILLTIAAVSIHISLTYGLTTIGSIIYYIIFVGCFAYFLYNLYRSYWKKK